MGISNHEGTGAPQLAPPERGDASTLRSNLATLGAEPTKPPLTIVSGAPGAGKTTLARRLAIDLSLPLLIKDELKETLADAMGIPSDVEASSRLGAGAYAVLGIAARRVLDRGVGLIIESNFRRGRSESTLMPLVALADARLIHCDAPAETCNARYLARFSAGRRHAAHLDDHRLESLRRERAEGQFEPLALGIPTLIVGTDDGLVPAYADIVAFAGGRAWREGQ